jgi:microcystin-dependent protein
MAYLGFDPQVSSTSYRNIDDISASFDGLVTTFPLRVGGVVPGIAPINEQQLLINVGGVPQQPDPSGVNGFRLSAGNIIFSSAPSIGEKFWGVILAGVDRTSAGISYPDGSVTAPAITFDTQTTTGFYRSGSNQLAVALNNINPVTFTQSGLQFNGSTSGTVTVVAPAVASNNTLKLPTTGTVLSAIIPGEVKWFAMSTAPTGFLKANGAAVSRTTYAALFSAIGTTFGVGDGSSTFNLPDLRGEFVRGWADDRAVDTGRAFGSAQGEAFASHAHGVNDPGHAHLLDYLVPLQLNDTDRGGNSATFSIDNVVQPATTVSGTNISIQNSGGAETRPRNIAILACIAF